ncbi:MAG: hypothetical protein M3Y37_02935 [Chloroflexota bacterium]|nr:hypothetical protein [Chloroflexota bacterium]
MPADHEVEVSLSVHHYPDIVALCRACVYSGNHMSNKSILHHSTRKEQRVTSY